MKKIKIYQLPLKHEAKFMDYDFVKEHGIIPQLSDYKMVWEGELDNSEFDNELGLDALDVTFTIFNGMKKGGFPSDFKGHSLSVSDVVEMDGKFYYCDDMGWEEISFNL